MKNPRITAGLILLLVGCLWAQHANDANTQTAWNPAESYQAALPEKRVWTAEPATPNASRATRAVLRYIAALPMQAENRVLSGQNLGIAGTPPDILTCQQKFVAALDINAYGGQRVALVGADYGWNLLADPSLITTTNAVLIDFWKQGGLVTMSFHTGNPFVENGTAKTLTQHPLSDLITPGTEANGRWMQTLAKVADGLEELKNAGVVVLWRPFHEANGGWFWWAHPKHKNGWTPAGEFVALWRHMFAYFVQERDLDNLLWVYNANYRSSPGLLPVDYYYPGAAYVDLVSLDIYADTLYPAPAAQRGCEDLRAFDKPIALAEVGPATFSGEFDAFQVIKFIQDFCPETTYFLFWNSWESTGFSGPVRHKAALIDQHNYRQLLNHPWVITLDEIDRGD